MKTCLLNMSLTWVKVTHVAIAIAKSTSNCDQMLWPSFHSCGVLLWFWRGLFFFLFFWRCSGLARFGSAWLRCTVHRSPCSDLLLSQILCLLLCLCGSLDPDLLLSSLLFAWPVCQGPQTLPGTARPPQSLPAVCWSLGLIASTDPCLPYFVRHCLLVCYWRFIRVHVM